MSRTYRVVPLLAVLVLLLLHGVSFADSTMRFQFTQPNFSGGPGNSLFGVATTEARGGGEYLELQRENLELDAVQKKVEIENERIVLERNKLNLQSDKINLENKVAAQSVQASSAGEPEPESMSHDVYIINSGVLTYNEDEVVHNIEAGEYNDVDAAIGTGDVEQNPTSFNTILIESGN